MRDLAQSVTMIQADQAQPYSEVLSLPPLSCKIRAGEMVFLTGLHHSLLHPYMLLLSGQTVPVSGELSILGKSSHEYSAHQRLQLHKEIGFVLQGGPLLSVLNGEENLKLAARYHQTGSEENIDKMSKELLQEMPGTNDRNLLPVYMSKLFRRHLAIARPLMLGPKVLFIDNPFEGLGYHDKGILAGYIANIVKNRGVTVVMSSDDLYFAHKYADQIIHCDADDALVFDSWKSLYLCERETLTSLFKVQRIKKDVKRK